MHKHAYFAFLILVDDQSMKAAKIGPLENFLLYDALLGCMRCIILIN